MAQSDRQVISWFQCWQAVSSFLFALCELQAKPLNLNPCLFLRIVLVMWPLQPTVFD